MAKSEEELKRELAAMHRAIAAEVLHFILLSFWLFYALWRGFAMETGIANALDDEAKHAAVKRFAYELGPAVLVTLLTLYWDWQDRRKAPK
jgi:hypothetical protein